MSHKPSELITFYCNGGYGRKPTKFYRISFTPLDIVGLLEKVIPEIKDLPGAEQLEFAESFISLLYHPLEFAKAANSSMDLRVYYYLVAVLVERFGEEVTEAEVQDEITSAGMKEVLAADLTKQVRRYNAKRKQRA